jgi:hypothetical protein
MTCFCCESRRREEFKKEIGVIPVGETYLSTDPPRRCGMIHGTLVARIADAAVALAPSGIFA